MTYVEDIVAGMKDLRFDLEARMFEETPVEEARPRLLTAGFVVGFLEEKIAQFEAATPEQVAAIEVSLQGIEQEVVRNRRG